MFSSGKARLFCLNTEQFAAFKVCHSLSRFIHFVQLLVWLSNFTEYFMLRKLALNLQHANMHLTTKQINISWRTRQLANRLLTKPKARFLLERSLSPSRYKWMPYVFPSIVFVHINTLRSLFNWWFETHFSNGNNFRGPNFGTHPYSTSIKH